MPRRTKEEVDAILRGRSSQGPQSDLPFIKIGLAFGGIIVSLIALYVVLGPKIRANLGVSTASDIHSLCMSYTQEMNKGNTDEMAKVFVSGISVAICDSMKESCENEPNGKDCQQAKRMIQHIARSR